MLFLEQGRWGLSQYSYAALEGKESKENENMESSTRGGFLIAGSIVAFFGFILPGVYGVNYNPPAHSAAASINRSMLY